MQFVLAEVRILATQPGPFRRYDLATIIGRLRLLGGGRWI